MRLVRAAMASMLSVAACALAPEVARACETGAWHSVRDADAVVLGRVLRVQKDEPKYHADSRVAVVRVERVLRGQLLERQLRYDFIRGWSDEFCGSLEVKPGDTLILSVVKDGGEITDVDGMSRRFYSELRRRMDKRRAR